AAADAEQAVMDPEAEGLLVPASTVPVLHDEAQGRAALLETFVLQRRELVQPRRQDRPRPDPPDVRSEPRALTDGVVDEPVGGERPQAQRLNQASAKSPASAEIRTRSSLTFGHIRPRSGSSPEPRCDRAGRSGGRVPGP